MTLFCFYAWHSFKNQIKKLFRTWVAVFILACLVLGVIIGLGVGLIASLAGGTEEAPDPAEAKIAEDVEEEEPILLTDPDTGEVLREISPLDIFELIVSAVVLAIVCLMVLLADKSNIFLPGDTVMLFTAPIAPQKVLLFRLGCQMGAFLVASLYILGQIPNLMRIPGFGWAAVLGLAFTYTMTLIQGILLKSAAFIFGTGNARKQRLVRASVYGVLVLIAGAWIVYSQFYGTGAIFTDGLILSLKGWIRYIPILGWLRAVPAYAFEGRYGMMLLFAAANVALTAAMLWGIYHMKADYYEPALAKSDEYALLLEKTQKNGINIGGNNKTRDRSERFPRNALRKGSGANIFFFKEMYNRKRFALFGLFSKTFWTYLVLGFGLTVILHFAGVHMLLPAAGVIALIAFYRTLGNPLEADTKLHYFSLVPAGTYAKLFWSILAGLTSTMLDAFLPLVLCAVLARASVWETLCSFLLILALDFYATCTSAFINLSLPNNAGKNIKQLVQVMFLYFGLIPIAGVIAVGAVLGVLNLGLVGGAVLSAGLGALFFAFLPNFV